MTTLLQDIRYALRMLAKSPGFTVIAVLTLALGIGANTAIFSVINSTLLEPLPFKNPAQLVDLRESESAPGDYPLDAADFLDWQAQNSTFSSMSLYSFPRGFNASGEGATESAAVRTVEGNFFDTLGVQPLIGRTFAKGEDQGVHHLVILSYGFWQRHFGGAANALGKTVELNSEPYTVIGVMPRWLAFPSETDLFIPLDMTAARMHDRGSHWINGLGRIKPGVTIGQARADLMTVFQRLIKQYRKPDDTDVHSLIFPLKDRLTGNSRQPLLILFGAVALVLLVACANIANLLLARATSRQRELAVRVALGAGRGRIARQLLTESVLLSLIGAGLGLLAASWAVDAIAAAKTLPIPRANPIHLNITVLVFTMAISVLVGILFGLAPAVQAGRMSLSDELKSSANAVVSATAGRKILRDALVVGEIAVSLALLVGAGLLLRSFSKLRNANIGVDKANVLTMNLDLPAAHYATYAANKQFYDELLRRVAQTPGVTSAAASSEIAVEGGSNGYIKVPGVTNPALVNQLVEVNYISLGYFKTFGIPLIEGRNFTAADAQQAGDVSAKLLELYKTAKDPENLVVPTQFVTPVVINQTMAKTFWANQDPIGKAYTWGGAHQVVVGVVGDTREFGIRELAIPENYLPWAASLDYPGAGGVISVKTAVAPTSVIEAVRNEVRGLDSSLALYHVRTMEQVVADGMQDATLQAFLLGLFAAVALLMAAIGLYGVMAYMVTQRTHEIGIRMALGAQRSDALKLVMGHGAKLTAIGLAIGVGAALGLTRLLSTALFGVTATDPATYIAVAILLAIVALAACYIPARRATAVDPMVALRYE
ncbi:MAG: ABC transporter permease [Candidatus Acidiferrales bacterium]